VPFPAGGSTDVGARLIGEHLSRSLGQQILVENKSGANGNIGMETAAKSAADGYTVLVTTDAVSSNPHVYKMNIDPLRELTPVIQLSRQPIVLAAHPSLGIASLAELIALARQQPGLRYATGSGVGAQHIVVQWFASIAGIKLEQVPYRGGAPTINDLAAAACAIDASARAEPAGRADVSGSRDQGPRAREVARRVRASGNAARHRGPPQRRH
jgi:tripartite-type tricarboxylate transporter receptor subunit TctC